MIRVVNIRKVLMCRPTFFDVIYEINPWMHTNVPVDKRLAMQQWEKVAQFYRDLGVEVEILEGHPDYPDMVFIANSGIVQDNLYIKANFFHKERRKEPDLVEPWFRDHGYQIKTLPEDISFEGTGDALLFNNVILGGFGFRTSEKAYPYLCQWLDREAITVRLNKPKFYHLDTAIAVLNDQTVLCHTESFTEEDLDKLKKVVPDLITISTADNNLLASNGVCVGNKFIVNKGISEQLKDQLKERSIETVEVDTSEFIKAGGSVWCMTLII